MKIGIKIKAKADSGAFEPIFALRQIELYDVESGEFIQGVANVTVDFPVDGALTVTASILPTEIRGVDGELYQTKREHAKLPANDHPAADTAETRRG